MNVIVAGAGRVGFHLARLLTTEGHDVTVIESDPNSLEQIDAALDVSTALGSASSVLLLREVGAGKADFFVSATGNDEVNFVAAAAAKGLGAKQVVARVDSPSYVESSILYESILGIDYVLSPEALTALEIANYIESPGMVASQDFGKGLVQMRQMRVTKSPTTRGKTVRDVFPPGSDVLLGFISRNGEILIPHGETIVKPNDVVTLVGKSEKIQETQKLFQGTEPKPRNVVVMGGGSIGLHLAQALEGGHRSVTLFEWNMSKCRALAALLESTRIVCRDATSRASLEEENVGSADVFVAATSDDERNIMASLLAKEVGINQAIAVVHHPDFAPLAAKLGIDHAVTPRASIANRILKLVYQKGVTSLAVLEEGQVEIVEFDVSGRASILGRRLSDLRSKLPKGALVATILRGDQVIVPSGGDEIHAGDSVVMIVTSDSLQPVQKLFL